MYGVPEQVVCGVPEQVVYGVPEQVVYGVPEQVVYGVPEQVVYGVPEQVVHSVTYYYTAAGLFIPESVQSPVWILQSRRQQLPSGVSWMVVAQVQISQMGGVGAQS